MNFLVTTEGENRLNLREACQAHVDSLWVPDHLLPHEAEEFVLDHFKRTVIGELEMLVVVIEGQDGRSG
ncbi:MAG: hypothetical protein RIC55_07970 [Pirellulaceae bacterium]